MLATSCENEITIDLKPAPTQLIIHAQMNADSTNNRIFLNLTDPVKLKDVTDGIIEIRINGLLAETPQRIAPTEKKPAANSYLVTAAFRPGDVVRVDARTANGQYRAWSEVVVPQPAFIEGAIDTLTTQIRYQTSYRAAVRYGIHIKDRPGEKNYYRLIVEQQGTFAYIGDKQPGEVSVIKGKTTHMIIRDDIVLTDGKPSHDTDQDLFDQPDNLYGIFDDKRFADSSYTMSVYTLKDRFLYFSNYDVRVWWQVDAYVRVLSISEAEYRYLQTLNIVDSDTSGEIMEPVKFGTNVNGGLGIVSISSEVSRKVSFPKQIYPK